MAGMVMGGISQTFTAEKLANVALDNTITMGCVPTVQHQDLTVLQLELTHVLNVAHARTHNSDQDVGAAVQVLVQAAEDVVEGRCLQAAREIAYLIITAVHSVIVERIQWVVTQEDAPHVKWGNIQGPKELQSAVNV
jgi:hypothetical protein